MDESPCAEHGREVLGRPQAAPRREPRDRLRGGPLSQHRRVLGPWHRDVPDPRRHVHACVPVLLRQLGQARRAAGHPRAAPPRAGGRDDGALAHRGDLGRPRRPARQGSRALRCDDPRAQGEAARVARRGPDARLPGRRGGGARHRRRSAPRGVQPQHRDRAQAPPQDARREGELRRRPDAAAAREGDRGLPRPDQVGDHRRARRDQRRGRRHDARPARERRGRRHDRPVPAAVVSAREDRPLGPPRRVPLDARAGRGARVRLRVRRPARALELPRGDGRRSR